MLVVDDLPDMRQLIASSLCKHGYDVIRAKHGREGLESAKLHLPSLIVTDWMMPEMTGPEMIEAIRSDPALIGVPVVLLTAKSDEESRLAGKEIGADAFLGKPFNTQELISTVRNLVQLKEVSAREVRHAKSVLTQSEKLAQLGAMVASIGHELANPLMLVSMSTVSLKENLTELETRLMPIFVGTDDAEEAGVIFQAMIDKLYEIIQNTMFGSKKLQELSTALRTQSRMEQSVTAGVELNEVVKEAMTLAGGRTKQHEVSVILGELPPITCYRSKVGQVVTNLLANAADALTEKIKLAKIANEQRFEGQISVVSEPREQGGKAGVVVTISDNGDGVPEHIREKVFDQFFTTKPAGAGTGLGLSMCADIVKEHGGILTVGDAEVLGGACFEMWLPLQGGKNPPKVRG